VGKKHSSALEGAIAICLYGGLCCLLEDVFIESVLELLLSRNESAVFKAARVKTQAARAPLA
jgi:hypothetical protein